MYSIKYFSGVFWGRVSSEGQSLEMGAVLLHCCNNSRPRNSHGTRLAGQVSGALDSHTRHLGNDRTTIILVRRRPMRPVLLGMFVSRPAPTLGTSESQVLSWRHSWDQVTRRLCVRFLHLFSVAGNSTIWMDIFPKTCYLFLRGLFSLRKECDGSLISHSKIVFEARLVAMAVASCLCSRCLLLMNHKTVVWDIHEVVSLDIVSFIS